SQRGDVKSVLASPAARIEHRSDESAFGCQTHYCWLRLANIPRRRAVVVRRIPGKSRQLFVTGRAPTTERIVSVIATALRVQFSRQRCGLARGLVIATALRVQFSRRRYGLGQGLRRSRWRAGLVRSKRAAQPRVQPSGGRRSPEWFGRSLLPRGRAGVVAALRGAA